VTTELVHGYIQAARGMCTDEEPYVAIDRVLAHALEAAKDLEEEVKRLRACLHEASRA
jgi:hypothetical protein